MKTIDADIKSRQFHNVYLLYGEEAYLRNQYRSKLLKAVTRDGDTMNVSFFSGKNCNVKEMIDMAETMPFLAEYRVLVIDDSGFFKSSNDEMLAYLDEIPESTILIFTEEQVTKTNKLYKAVDKKGHAAEFKAQTERLLVKWILTRLKKENKRITESVMYLFLSKTGTDMSLIDTELEKLIMYTYGKEIIEAEDVEAICSVQTSGKVFELVDAIARGEQKRALDLYSDLLTLKEPPMRILYLINRQFQILMQIKDLMNQGFDSESIAKKIGSAPFAVRKNMGQARLFSLEEIARALKEGMELELDVKTGNISDQLSVELMIVKYSGRKV